MPFLTTDSGGSGPARLFSFEDIVGGWRGLSDPWLLAGMAIVLLMAVLLGAAIAYHPRIRAKASTLEELDQPKTLIMYSLVGAVTALIVQVNPAMALVVFGIGGLMRFRTNVGPAKDTGRVILAAVVGMCCGLQLIVVAIFATAFGWVLLWYLESREFGRIQIKGLDRDTIPRAASVYRALLSEAGCRVLGEKKDFMKGTVAFVFAIPRSTDRGLLDERFSKGVPPDVRGAVDWE